MNTDVSQHNKKDTNKVYQCILLVGSLVFFGSLLTPSLTAQLASLGMTNISSQFFERRTGYAAVAIGSVIPVTHC